LRSTGIVTAAPLGGTQGLEPAASLEFYRKVETAVSPSIVAAVSDRRLSPFPIPACLSEHLPVPTTNAWFRIPFSNPADSANAELGEKIFVFKGEHWSKSR
jgi:hypothetical protein